MAMAYTTLYSALRNMLCNPLRRTLYNTLYNPLEVFGVKEQSSISDWLWRQLRNRPSIERAPRSPSNPRWFSGARAATA